MSSNFDDIEKKDGNSLEDNKDVLNSPLVMNVISLRNMVLYPGSVYPIFIGRRKSVAVLKKIEKEKATVFFVFQKSADSHILEMDDVYKYGVIAKVIQIIERYDHSLQVLVEVVAKAELLSFDLVDNVYSAKLQPVVQDIVDVESDCKAKVIEKELMERFQQISVYDSRVPNETVSEIAKLKD